jgi:A/G-specific adenine glycosylase
MLGLPSTDWSGERPDALTEAPVQADWKRVGEIEHVFTHFALTLEVWEAEGEGHFEWTPFEAANPGLPSVFRKALRLAFLAPSGERRAPPR